MEGKYGYGYTVATHITNVFKFVTIYLYNLSVMDSYSVERSMSSMNVPSWMAQYVTGDIHGHTPIPTHTCILVS